ncbi:hypothetical protein L208DRAFT_819926 [Tricholoma matsutake]|nr:hypothetical protein L208DRAFT_819926 [Tricholoma matsutake 945]
MDLTSQDQSPQSHPTVLVQNPELWGERERVSSTSSNGRRSFRAITHFAVLTAFILPVTLLPYLLSRRRLSSLQKQVDRMGASVRILQQDLGQASSEVAICNEENRRMRAMLHQMMQEADQLRLKAKQNDAERLAFDEAIRSDLQILLNERQESRAQAVTLRALGTSLADVAAFMHEVELEIGMLSQGTDRRGVDRLRLLAFRMAGFPRQNKTTNDPIEVGYDD